jgi:hypothetical protein
MAAEYALEKLMHAVDALATGAGPVQHRLGDAAIHLLTVRPEDIPEENLRRTLIGVSGKAKSRCRLRRRPNPHRPPDRSSR